MTRNALAVETRFFALRGHFVWNIMRELERMREKLESVTINGYKSIQNLEAFPLRDLNVIVGSNGAGKSNFISFFKLLHSFVGDYLNEFVKNQGGADAVLYNGVKNTPEMRFELMFGQRGYRFSLQPTLENLLVSSGEARFYAPAAHPWWSLGASMTERCRMAMEATGNYSDTKYSKPVYQTIMSWKMYHFHDTSNTAGMRRYAMVEDNDRLRYNASNIAPYVLRLREEFPVAYKRLVDTVKFVLPTFDDFLLKVVQFGPESKVALSWRQKGSDYPMQPYHLSDGSIRFICLAAALLQPEPPDLIILDEPELGLHPAAIAILAELIITASKSSQLIVATQSPLLLDAFEAEDIIVASQKDGVSCFKRLDSESLRVWLDRYSMGELWVKNVIEGGPEYV